MKAVAQTSGICPLGKDTNKDGTSRLDWLDALRALAMLLVMFGHLFKNRVFFQFANGIKIPLFFAISGYLLYGKTENPKAFFQRLLQRVVIPWLILSLGFGLRFVVTQGFGFYVNYAAEVLTGERLWYMVCCIIAQPVFYFLQKVFGSGWKLGIAVLLITAGGLTLSAFGVYEPFQIYTALIAQVFLLIGYWIKKYEFKLQSMKLWMCLGLLGSYMALVVLSMFLFPNRSMDVHQDGYYNIPYCFLLIIVGCVALFACAQRIKRFPRWLCFVGQNTLVFYIHAGFWTNMAERGFSLLGITVPKTWYGALIWLALSGIGCGFEAYVLNKFLPEANGKKRKKKSVQVGA